VLKESVLSEGQVYYTYYKVTKGARRVCEFDYYIYTQKKKLLLLWSDRNE